MFRSGTAFRRAARVRLVHPHRRRDEVRWKREMRVVAWAKAGRQERSEWVCREPMRREYRCCWGSGGGRRAVPAGQCESPSGAGRGPNLFAVYCCCRRDQPDNPTRTAHPLIRTTANCNYEFAKIIMHVISAKCYTSALVSVESWTRIEWVSFWFWSCAQSLPSIYSVRINCIRKYCEEIM